MTRKDERIEGWLNEDIRNIILLCFFLYIFGYHFYFLFLSVFNSRLPIVITLKHFLITFVYLCELLKYLFDYL